MQPGPAFVAAEQTRMQRLRHNRIVRALPALAAMGGLYLLTGCPIKYFTGVSCPGCGMTRAWWSVAAGNLAGAFYWHPLFWAVPLAGVLFIVARRRPMGGAKLCNGLFAALALLFVGVWVARFVTGQGHAVALEMPLFLKHIGALLGG